MLRKSAVVEVCCSSIFSTDETDEKSQGWWVLGVNLQGLYIIIKHVTFDTTVQIIYTRSCWQTTC